MRNQFTYLDNNSTTRISPSVREAMEPFLKNQFGNPSNDTSIGRKAKEAIQQARNRIADLLGASPGEILFTSCGSESNAVALHSCITASCSNGIVLTTPVEHDSIRMYLRSVMDDFSIEEIPVNHNGQLDIEYIDTLDADAMRFCSIMLVNNEIGNIYPIKTLVNKLKKLNSSILFHTDAVQALGKIDISVHELDIDYLSISGHKIHAPKGVGALYIREGAPYKPLIFGHQENTYRGGTENVASIVGFGQAALDAKRGLDENNKKIGLMRDNLEKRLFNAIKDAGINGDISSRVSNTTNIYFPGVDSVKLLFQLELHGIFASAGSACNGERPQESHVLAAIHSPYPTSSIRISLDAETDDEDINYFVANCIEAVKKIKGGS